MADGNVVHRRLPILPSPKTLSVQTIDLQLPPPLICRCLSSLPLWVAKERDMGRHSPSPSGWPRRYGPSPPLGGHRETDTHPGASPSPLSRVTPCLVSMQDRLVSGRVRMSETLLWATWHLPPKPTTLELA